MQKKLIVGLGNWPEKFAKTKHNTGFIVLNFLQESLGFDDFKENKKLEGFTSHEKVQDKEVILLKPMTMMNSSGVSVKKAANFYKIKTENIIVVHDDSDIKFGEFKISKNKSSGGHKGVESIIQELKDKNFYRVRVGIRSEKDKNKKASDFVLKKFSKEEIEKLNKLLPKILEEIKKII